MKFCNLCGHGNEDDAVFCIQCGIELTAEAEAPAPPPGIAVPPSPVGGPPPPPGAYQVPPPGVPITRPKPNDGSAIASLIMGIAAFLVCPLVLGVLAVVFGYVGRRNIMDSGGTLDGESFAVAGIILGWINIAIVAIFAIIILAVRL